MAAAILAFLSGENPAQAASFDCAKAQSPIEVAICKNPYLDRIDEEMGQVYRKAKGMLSGDGRKLLLQNQMIFLHDLENICFSTDPLIVTHPIGSAMREPPAVASFSPTDRCLASHLQRRTQHDLAHAVQISGGRTFLRLATFRLARAVIDVPEGYEDNVMEQSLAWIQIDQPHGPAETAFNDWARKLFETKVCDLLEGFDDECALDRAHDPFPKSTIDFEAELGAKMLTDDLISVETAIAYYGLSAAHSDSKQSRTIWSLSLGRELMASDIFDPQKDWDRALSAWAQRRVRPTIYGGTKDDLRPIETIADTELWSFERGGLRLIWGQYMLGGYLDAAEAFLPWSILTPWLKPDGPFDWRSVAVGAAGHHRNTKRPRN